MKVFNSIPEPWAKVVAVIATSCLGVWFGFIIDPGFGMGMACGGVACMIIHWAGRIDERPLWQHVFGREAVYADSPQTQEARLEEEVGRLKLKVAELLGRQDCKSAPASVETGLKATVDNPAEH